MKSHNIFLVLLAYILAVSVYAAWPFWLGEWQFSATAIRVLLYDAGLYIAGAVFLVLWLKGRSLHSTHETAISLIQELHNESLRALAADHASAIASLETRATKTFDAIKLLEPRLTRLRETLESYMTNDSRLHDENARLIRHNDLQEEKLAAARRALGEDDHSASKGWEGDGQGSADILPDDTQKPS